MRLSATDFSSNSDITYRIRKGGLRVAFRCIFPKAPGLEPFQHRLGAGLELVWSRFGAGLELVYVPVSNTAVFTHRQTISNTAVSGMATIAYGMEIRALAVSNPAGFTHRQTISSTAVSGMVLIAYGMVMRALAVSNPAFFTHGRAIFFLTAVSGWPHLAHGKVILCFPH